MQLDVTDKPIAARALALATWHHRGTTRKYTGEPYINHPIAVAEILLRYGVTDQEVLAAALLHDCLEDESAITGGVLSSWLLQDHCGARVLRWVELLSNTEKGNRAQRKAAAAQRIAGAPWQVQAIKLADILDNCKDIASCDPDFAETYIEEKRKMVRGLPPTTQKNDRMANDAMALLSDQMNELAMHRLMAGVAIDARRKATEAEILSIIAEEESSVYADVAMF